MHNEEGWLRGAKSAQRECSPKETGKRSSAAVPRGACSSFPTGQSPHRVSVLCVAGKWNQAGSGLELRSQLPMEDICCLLELTTVTEVKTPKTFQKKRQRRGPQWLKGNKSLGILGENPALVMVKQWRRPAAAALCAGCAKGSSSPE